MSSVITTSTTTMVPTSTTSKSTTRLALASDQVPLDWWSPSSDKAFFQSVYRNGDNSREGHLTARDYSH
jgi:hypothetical protein